VAATHGTEKTVEIHQSYITRPASGWLPALFVDCLTGDSFMVETTAIHFQEGPDAGNPVKEV
jgi:hypothetical protein